MTTGNGSIELGGAQVSDQATLGQSAPHAGARRAHPSAPDPRDGSRGATAGPLLATTPLTIGDVTRSLAEWAHASGVPLKVLRERLRLGVDAQDALRPGDRRARLHLADVRALRARRAAGASLAELARAHGIHPTQASRIARGLSWKEAS